MQRICRFLLLSAFLLFFPGPVRPDDVPAGDEPEGATGLTLRLGSAAGRPERARQPRAPQVVALSDAEAQRVLSSMPDLSPLSGSEAEFALRPASVPPPRTGATVEVAFPPPQSVVPPPAPPAGPLRVVRRAPDGEVPLASQLSVTFSEPMVAVTSHGELASAAPVVRVEPAPAGQWRWVGTKTLLFEPAGRFPMATEYRVAIAAGQRSALGGTLAEAVAWTFATPAPGLVEYYPRERATRRQPVLFAAFDQRIDPAAVLPFIRLQAAGAPALRLATPAEVKADDPVHTLAVRAGEGRWLAFVPESPLAAGASVEVSLAAGLPSAEGPRTTARAQSWSFRSPGALRVEAQRCSSNDRGPCRAGESWAIRFSNALDAEAFRSEQVTVTPALPGADVEVSGSWLYVRGRSQRRTEYRVTLSSAIADTLGQTLGKDQTRTFRVKGAEPQSAVPRGVVVLDPAGGPELSAFTVNHGALRVRAYKVTPKDWPAFVRFRQERSNDERVEAPWRLAFDRTLRTRGREDELTETRIDLRPVLANGRGHAVLVIEPLRPAEPRPREYLVWVQATGIAVDAFSDATHLLAWTNALSDGKPLADCDVSLDSGAAVRSGADGMASLPLPDSSAQLLLARCGDDVAFLQDDSYEPGELWRRRTADDEYVWYVFDDRHLYRPGEEVKVKGWVRRREAGPSGDVALPDLPAPTVGYRLLDSVGTQRIAGKTAVGPSGGFELSLALPQEMNLGAAFLQFDLPETSKFRHSFEVEEFRRPEFEVTASADDGPHVVGEHADVSVQAAYFAGGALPDAPVEWRVRQRPGSYRPPQRDDFAFGTENRGGYWIPWQREVTPKIERFEARTDLEGRHVLRMDLLGVSPARPMQVVAEAIVTDVNRQAWSASQTLLVHPAELYVGLRSERAFLQRGDPIDVAAIVTDLDGAAVGGRPFRVVAERVEARRAGRGWRVRTSGTQECTTQSDAEAVRCSFRASEAGLWRVTAVVEDAEERRNQTQVWLWAAGEGALPPRDPSEDAVTLIPDRVEYRAGQTAELLVLAPFFPAHGVLTLRRSGLVRHERFEMSGTSHTLRVPIEEGWTPNVHAQVDLVGEAPPAREDGASGPALPPRPVFAAGETDLSIPPVSRALALRVVPRDAETEPGAKTGLDLEVADAEGRPVANAELAVVVVDDALLALADYRLPDPLEVFYEEREADVRDLHLRELVVLAGDRASAEAALMSGSGIGNGSGSGAVVRARAAGLVSEPEPYAIRVRKNFSPLALFAGSVPTDARGRAELPFTLPDNLTRYRVMAVVASGANRFGSGEATFTARLPLMVRPSPPRFLNFGDRFELPVVVQNQTARELKVQLAVRAHNAELTAGAGRVFTVPARDRIEVRLPAAARRPGTATFQLAGVADRFADAAQVSLPVWTPATTEAFATYGQLERGAIAQPVAAPADAVREFGGLELTTSSTSLQALTDAVLYLVTYRFECAEQLASRVLAVAALRDVLAAFSAEGLPPADDLVATVERDLKRLAELQNDDGGFGFWRRGEPSLPYLSIHVAHALERAQAKGFTVAAPVRKRALEYLRAIERHMPKDYDARVRQALRAYALYVRLRMGERDASGARALLAEGVEQLPLEVLGWLLPVVSGDPESSGELAVLRRQLANRASETASTASFATDYGEQGASVLLHSQRRTDAVLLEALIADQPQSELVPKLVEGLLAQRRQGRWENTQENAFVLLALDRYFSTYEKTTPDFVVRAWLGDRLAADETFRGRSTERCRVAVPMGALRELGSSRLVLAMEGAGRLYYRIGMRYAPERLALEAADHGFTVERSYVAVDDPGDVRRDRDGTWHIRAGARVRVQLSLAAEGRRYHVALVDALPAGLEALNPALAMTEKLPRDANPTQALLGSHRWRSRWFDHQNLRDERVEVFTALLWEGVYAYAYFARATTPGSFVVPPTRAEEMYHPETFGRSASERVIVEAAEER